MIMENKVSLWLGNYINAEELNSYINIHYDEDGNTIPSKFQIDFDIEKYDTDAIESDRISDCRMHAGLSLTTGLRRKQTPEREKYTWW